MAIFSNKIVDVYYTDENLSNVTILYNYEKDGETLVGEYHLLVDETEAQFQDLMKEVTYQDIELATLEIHKVYREQLQAIVDEVTSLWNPYKPNSLLVLPHNYVLGFEGIKKNGL